MCFLPLRQLERYIHDVLINQPYRLKLLNPLGVGLYQVGKLLGLERLAC
jgi:hypothetical protein